MNFSFTSKRERRSSVTSSLLMAAVMCVTATAPALASNHNSATTASAPQTDDTLLVLLAPHADRTKIATDLSSGAKVKCLKDIHVDTQDYSVLHVQAATGQAKTAMAQIKSMMKSNPNIKSVGHNYLVHAFRNKGFIGGGSVVSPPNDPYFSQQWPLAAMRWTAAQAQYNHRQVMPANITILSSGATPVYTNNELGPAITQFNCLVNPPVPEDVQGFDPEGDIDASITGCLTDNSTLLAGSGSFGRFPTRISMLRITNGGGAYLSDILNALVFRINNQHKLGGPGPVNLSYGGGNPNLAQVSPNLPLWTDPNMQAAATSLLAEGSLLVLSAGDTGTAGPPAGSGTWSSAVAPAGNIVVVQGTDINNNFDTVNLTRLQNDPVAAPGDPQPALINGQFSDQFYGTSFSAPLWCSAISMLMSMNPHLTALQAHQILVSTGTPAGGAGYPAVVPAFDKSIKQVVGF
ncbi:MAG TPA: S8 family serine peptidase [Drouetiella sp.]|jgi:Subtilase family